MDIPNLVGLKLEDAEIELKKIPDLQWNYTLYLRPAIKKEFGKTNNCQVKRIIRQKLIDTKKLELIISVFYEKTIVS